jgi:hypothetical protein
VPKSLNFILYPQLLNLIHILTTPLFRIEKPLLVIQNRFYPAPDLLLQGMPQLLIFASGLQFSFPSLFFIRMKQAQ